MKFEKLKLTDPDFNRKFVASLKHTGFATIENNVLSKLELIEFYRDWANFFQSEDKFNINKKRKRDQGGYFPFKSENAKDSPTKDLKEFYHFYHDDFALNEDMFIPTWEIFKRLNDLGQKLLLAIDSELNTQFQPMAQHFDNTLFRILHYPPIQDAKEGEVRASAHQDINLLTILPSATATGLEVLDGLGNWHRVDTDPDTFVVNAGDMLQEASGGYFKSTTHRVVNPEGNNNVSRYSSPLFIHPRSNVRLSDKYTAGEYLEERLKELGLK